MQAYIQTSGKTTAPASLMAIINHFKPEFKLSREHEFVIWRETATLPVLASSVFGLAIYARKQGLSPHIIVENAEFYYPNYRFMGYTKIDIDNAKYSSELYRRQAIAMGIPIEERKIEYKEILDFSRKGRIMLLRINEGTIRSTRSVAKFIVVYGYGEGKFYIVDPHQGAMRIDERILKEAFETLETKGKRDHRMIVFE